MGILIKWAVKIVGERFAPILAYGFVVLLLVLGLWWLRADAYSDGVRDEKASWEAAVQAAREQAEESAEEADEKSDERNATELDRVEREKEKLDEAAEQGSDPFDVLFPAG